MLIFTFIGYSKQEIVVGNQAKINVQLKEDAQNLDEVGDYIAAEKIVKL